MLASPMRRLPAIEEEVGVQTLGEPELGSPGAAAAAAAAVHATEQQAAAAAAAEAALPGDQVEGAKAVVVETQQSRAAYTHWSHDQLVQAMAISTLTNRQLSARVATLKARSAHSRALIGQQAVRLAALQRRLARQATGPMRRIEAARGLLAAQQPGRVAAIFDNLAKALAGGRLQPGSFLLQYLGDALANLCKSSPEAYRWA
jgi:predicted RNA-binding protein Jag